MPREKHAADLRERVNKAYRDHSPALGTDGLPEAHRQLTVIIFGIGQALPGTHSVEGVSLRRLKKLNALDAVKGAVRAWAQLYTTVDYYTGRDAFRNDPLYMTAAYTNATRTLTRAADALLHGDTKKVQAAERTFVMHELALVADAICVYAVLPHSNVHLESARPRLEQPRSLRGALDHVGADGSNVSEDLVVAIAGIELPSTVRAQRNDFHHLLHGIAVTTLHDVESASTEACRRLSRTRVDPCTLMPSLTRPLAGP